MTIINIPTDYYYYNDINLANGVLMTMTQYEGRYYWNDISIIVLLMTNDYWLKMTNWYWLNIIIETCSDDLSIIPLMVLLLENWLLMPMDIVVDDWWPTYCWLICWLVDDDWPMTTLTVVMIIIYWLTGIIVDYCWWLLITNVTIDCYCYASAWWRMILWYWPLYCMVWPYSMTRWPIIGVLPDEAAGNIDDMHLIPTEPEAV